MGAKYKVGDKVTIANSGLIWVVTHVTMVPTYRISPAGETWSCPAGESELEPAPKTCKCGRVETGAFAPDTIAFSPATNVLAHHFVNQCYSLATIKHEDSQPAIYGGHM